MQKPRSERDSLPLLLQPRWTLSHKYFFTLLSLPSVLSICSFVAQLKEEQEGGAEGSRVGIGFSNSTAAWYISNTNFRGSCMHRSPSGKTTGPKLSLYKQHARASSWPRRHKGWYGFFLNSLTPFRPHITVASLPLPSDNSSGSTLCLRPCPGLAWENDQIIFEVTRKGRGLKNLKWQSQISTFCRWKP